MNSITENPSDRWNRVAALLDAVLDREPNERTAYLSAACGHEESLKAEVESLLAGASAPSFLDSGAFVVAAPLLEAASLGDESISNMPRGLSYELERKLGRGGMATVFLARDAKHDRRVAVKVLHAELTESLGAQRFVQEIRLTARLQHPHVLALLDSGVFGPDAGPFSGRPYYVMPYVEGESLRVRLERDGSLSPSDAMRVLREVADALTYAHEQGVVHRDIKPENILLSRDHAVVADFGIAKALATARGEQRPLADGVSPKDLANSEPLVLTHASTLIGTPAYMAPEQAAGAALVDERADLYAWGVVAYELLGGRHPFRDAMIPAELATAHGRNIARPLHEVTPAVSGAVSDLVMRCLATAPNEQPGSAAEIVATLDRAAMTAVPAAPEVALPIARPRRRFRLAAVGALVTVLVASAIMYVYYRQELESDHVVVGTGKASIDVLAVQKAVKRGGHVVLEGRFSFDAAATNPISSGLGSRLYPPMAEVLVSKPVTITGMANARGEMPTIEGGTTPFYVVARGSVTIRGLRFVRPTGVAILVYAAHDLEITQNRIEGLALFGDGYADGIVVDTKGDIPLPTSPGAPENVSGHLVIRSNDIDAVGSSSRQAADGIRIFSVGKAPDSVLLDVIGNHVQHTTGPAINIRRVQGQVRVESNAVETSPVLARNGNDAVRLANTGVYLIADNTIRSEWPTGAGIAVFSQSREWPMESAVMSRNIVTMLPPAGTILDDSSAAINIRGFARRVVIRDNVIQGRARAGIALYGYKGGVPEDNTLIDNRFLRFTPTVSDIFVGSEVLRTRIVRPPPGRTVRDRGEGTIIQR